MYHRCILRYIYNSTFLHIRPCTISFLLLASSYSGISCWRVKHWTLPYCNSKSCEQGNEDLHRGSQLSHVHATRACTYENIILTTPPHRTPSNGGAKSHTYINSVHVCKRRCKRYLLQLIECQCILPSQLELHSASRSVLGKCQQQIRPDFWPFPLVQVSHWSVHLAMAAPILRCHTAG